jgi:hypothetical protein
MTMVVDSLHREIQQEQHPNLGPNSFALVLAGWIDLFRGRTIRRMIVACGCFWFQQVLKYSVLLALR